MKKRINNKKNTQISFEVEEVIIYKNITNCYNIEFITNLPYKGNTHSNKQKNKQVVTTTVWSDNPDQYIKNELKLNVPVKRKKRRPVF